MSSPKLFEDITTPVGQLVNGAIFEPTSTDGKGKALTHKDGTPKEIYFARLAIEKNSPDWLAFWAALNAFAQRCFPGGENLSLKVFDGDGENVRKYPGYAGCWMLKAESIYEPSKFAPPTADGSDPERITNPNYIKLGDYVRLGIRLESNNSTQSPGVYVRPHMVQLMGCGKAIVKGPNVTAHLSAPVTYVPSAMQAVPAGAAPPPAATPPPPPAATPPPPPAATPPPPQMTAKAGGLPYASYIAQGWDDAQLIAQGYMVPPAATPTAPPPPPAATPTAPPPPPAATPTATPAAPPTKAMTSKAAGATYESFISQGWTDEQLIAQQYLVVTAAGVQPNTSILT